MSIEGFAGDLSVKTSGDIYFGLPKNKTTFTRQSLISVVLAKNARNSKITDFNVKLLKTIYHNILEFQISVYNFPLVTIINGIYYLSENKLGLFLPDALIGLFL